MRAWAAQRVNHPCEETNLRMMTDTKHIKRKFNPDSIDTFDSMSQINECNSSFPEKEREDPERSRPQIEGLVD